MAETARDDAFGNLLRAHRQTRGLTQEALAERTGIGTRTIQELERGTHQPYRETLARLVEGLGLSGNARLAFEKAAQPTLRSRPNPSVLPDGRDASPASVSPALPVNLPLALTSFIGRKEEIVEVKRLLQKARLLTLTGAGGVGKTSLALAVATQVQDVFADGISLIELASLADDQLVPQAVARAVGIHERPGEPILATVSRALRESHRLLILDNCEHLLLSSAQLAEALLRACPNLHLLVTSREPLRIGAEIVWRVPPLTLPVDPHPAFEEIAASEAVQLFVERAQAVRTGFVLDEANGPILAEICRQLDGIPLAIELAAARVNVLSPLQITRYLGDRFRLLTSGSRTALPRHQTLRATLDWSYDLLTWEERRLFHRLSVFVGGWTIEAAEAVCGEGVLDLLASLVDKSLVLVEERDGQTRFTMLETIREYALSHLLASGEADEVRDRHADWALALAEAAFPDMHTQEKHAIWLRTVGQDFPNLRAALRWLCEARDAERALRLVKVLWLYWDVHDEYADARLLVEAVLAVPGVIAYPTTLAAVWHAAAHLAGSQGDLATARAYYEAALAYHRQQGDRQELGSTLMWLGAVAGDQGDYTHALPWLEEGLTLTRDAGNPQELGFALLLFGKTLYSRGDLTRAWALLEESVSVYRHGGLTGMLTSQALAHLAVVVTDLGDYARAAAICREALTELGRFEDRMNIPLLLEGIASLAAIEGQSIRALRLIGCAQRLREEIGNPLGAFGQRPKARTLDLARRTLEPAAAEAALAAGRGMTLQEAVAYALDYDTLP